MPTYTTITLVTVAAPTSDEIRLGAADFLINADIARCRNPAMNDLEEVPEQVVQRQLAAYNARDLEAWLATYAEDAQQFELHGGLLAAGHAQMRERMRARFAEPDLQAQLLNRVVMGDIVVDHELITRNFDDGKGTVEMLCVYEVGQGLIRKASFKLGAMRRG